MNVVPEIPLQTQLVYLTLLYTAFGIIVGIICEPLLDPKIVAIVIALLPLAAHLPVFLF